MFQTEIELKHFYNVTMTEIHLKSQMNGLNPLMGSIVKEDGGGGRK